MNSQKWREKEYIEITFKKLYLMIMQQNNQFEYLTAKLLDIHDSPALFNFNDLQCLCFRVTLYVGGHTKKVIFIENIAKNKLCKKG